MLSYFIVLPCKKGGRTQKSDLLTGIDRFEGSAEGNLGLSESNVATNKAVHWLGAFHIALDIFDGLRLILGQRIWEFGFELGLQFVIWWESVAIDLSTLAIKGDELIGQFIDPVLDFPFSLLPFAGREAG